MRIGRYDLWNEYDSVAAVLGGNSRALELAYASAMANHPIQCWQLAKDSLMEFGCDPGQAAQLMSNMKDIRRLDLCTSLDPNMHVLRAYLGRCAYRTRMRLRPAPTLQGEQCIGSGIVNIGPDELMITDAHRNELEQEISSVNGTLAKTPHSMVLGEGGTPRAGFSASHALIHAILPLLSEVTGFSESKLLEELARTAFIQKVVNSPDDNDVQKVLHQDTWHDAWKLWYFPNNVKSGEGTFRFATYSHGLSAARLRLMKEFATRDKTWESWRSYGHDEGSWRVSDGELLIMGEGVHDIEATAGTLVIANVYGYHARGLANKLHERVSLHASIRINPWA